MYGLQILHETLIVTMGVRMCLYLCNEVLKKQGL